MSDKVSKLWDSIGAVILLIAAGVGIIYDLLHIVGSKLIDSLGSPELVLIALVAAMCVGLGVERLTILHRVDVHIAQANKDRRSILNRVNKIATGLGNIKDEVIEDLQVVGQKENAVLNAVSKINKVESLIGMRAIEEAAQKLINECGDDDKIKATGQYHVVDLSEEYFKTIALKVKEAAQNQGGMEYQVIVPPKTDSDSEVVDERTKAFKEVGIENRLIMRHAKNPWPFEVLIGGRSMIIALLAGKTGKGRANYDVAIRITDPDFVNKASEWFREAAWGEAESDS